MISFRSASVMWPHSAICLTVRPQAMHAPSSTLQTLTHGLDIGSSLIGSSNPYLYRIRRAGGSIHGDIIMKNLKNINVR